jgi:hypothetical protein
MPDDGWPSAGRGGSPETLPAANKVEMACIPGPFVVTATIRKG